MNSSNEGLWPTNKPSDCALLVAVPLTCQEFVSDVDAAQLGDPRRVRGDYAYGIAHRSEPGTAELAWHQHGAAVACLCLDLIDEARALGVTYIAERAERIDLRHATESEATVVIIVGHWRGAKVSNSDLRDPFIRRAAELIESPDDDFERELSRYLIWSGHSTKSDIAVGLNEFLKGTTLKGPDDIRDELDRRFSDGLVRGSCLELRDGYLKPAEAAALVCPRWQGIFELSVCHSIRLALALKQGRNDRFVITNEAQKQPDRCLRELRETLLRLSARHSPYLSLRAAVFAATSNSIERDLHGKSSRTRRC